MIHRDLKPANVMLDGAGKVRITDFGLAGAAGETLRAGTPAYMAPEQLAGSEVTAQSDIYALGLVLYELFTGQRAIEAKNVADLVRKREAGIVPPSLIVRDLDPAIDRAILRCLERDPADRPSSALGVAAALPGGDPLAAALAAGETPSPEMVAAAGPDECAATVDGTRRARVTLICLAAYAATSDRVLLTGNVPLSKPPEVLIDRAQEITQLLGYTEAPATGRRFRYRREYLRGSRDRTATRRRCKSTSAAACRALLFWYRTSPRQMEPADGMETGVAGDPPLTLTNMRTVIVDSSGRLVEFDRGAAATRGFRPPPRRPERTGRPSFRSPASTSVSISRSALSGRRGPIPTSESPGKGRSPDGRIRPFVSRRRLTAARPVFLQLVYPWTQPARMREAPRPRSHRCLQPSSRCSASSCSAWRHSSPGTTCARDAATGAARCASGRSFSWRVLALLVRATPRRFNDELIVSSPCSAGRSSAPVRSGSLPRPRTVRQEVLADHVDLVESVRCRQRARSAGRTGRADWRGPGRFLLLVGRLDQLVRPMLGYPAVRISSQTSTP